MQKLLVVSSTVYGAGIDAAGRGPTAHRRRSALPAAMKSPRPKGSDRG
jgi:hypothetical protein